MEILGDQLVLDQYTLKYIGMLFIYVLFSLFNYKINGMYKVGNM